MFLFNWITGFSHDISHWSANFGNSSYDYIFCSVFIWVLCGYHCVPSSRFSSFVFFCFCLGFKIPSFCLTLNGQLLHQLDTASNHINLCGRDLLLYRIINSIIIEYANQQFCQHTIANRFVNKIMMLKTFFRASIQAVKFNNFTVATKSCIEHDWPVVNVCCQNKWLFMVSCTMLTNYIRSYFIALSCWFLLFLFLLRISVVLFLRFQSRISNTNADELKYIKLFRHTLNGKWTELICDSL